MSHIKSLHIFILHIAIATAISSTFTHASTIFTVKNNCPYTVWAAAVPLGGGRQINSGGTWTIPANSSKLVGRIWARTGCTSTAPNSLKCDTGDCGGVLLCTTNGSPPQTLAEYALNQFNNMDIFDISLVEGFNVPMSFIPTSNGCTRGPSCSVDLNKDCPEKLKVKDGCNYPCTVFKTEEYCCYSGSCGSNEYFSYFKSKCPEAYSYPPSSQVQDNLSCPSGTNYTVTFCP